MPNSGAEDFFNSPITALGIGLLTSRTPQEGLKAGMGLLSANAERRRQEQLDKLQQMKLEREMAGGDNPANVKEWEYYNKLTPEQQKAYLGMKRALPTYDLGGSRAIGNPVTGLPDVNIPKTPPPQSMPDFEAAVTGAKKAAELDATKQASRGKVESAITALEQQSKLVTDNIDNAKATISPWSTGYGHMAFSSLPNTDARKLDNYLNTIKANVGFDKLQQMRDNSPTGGALGQVSEFENKLLQAVNGALDPLQRDQLSANLDTIKELYPKVLAERKAAFAKDYGQADLPTAADVFPSEDLAPPDNLPASLPPPGQAQPRIRRYIPGKGLQ